MNATSARPGARPVRIAIFSSKQRCGVQTYSATLADALHELGHNVELVGVGWWKSRELLSKAMGTRRGTDMVIVEHEFALYRNAALALAMAILRVRGIRIVLSMHELDPDKFWNYHKVVAALHFRLRGSPLGDLWRVLAAVFEAAQRMLRYRLTLWMLGAFPERIVFHSARAISNAGLVTGDERKAVLVPHFVEPLPGVSDPSVDTPGTAGAPGAGSAEAGSLAGERARSDGTTALAQKRALREKLGLPLETFVYVSPGFFFRRKRLIEAIQATPPDGLLVLAGTESPHDPGYLDEIRAYLFEHSVTNVLINTDYDAMPSYLMAADAVVLFYREGFQSGIASHAIWAEKPCIFSDDPAFDMYEGAGLRARDVDELRAAMLEVRKPEVADRLRRRARELKRELSPRAMAAKYLEGLA